jgi:hypothetical protein
MGVSDLLEVSPIPRLIQTIKREAADAHERVGGRVDGKEVAKLGIEIAAIEHFHKAAVICRQLQADRSLPIGNDRGRQWPAAIPEFQRSKHIDDCP